MPLTSLTSHLVGWAPVGIGTVAYYVHRGRVYLTGAIHNPRGGEADEHGGEGLKGAAVGSTIFTGLPAAIRPSVSHDIVLPILPSGTPEYDNKYLELAVNWTAHVTPEGTVVLASAPPAWLNLRPSPEVWYHEEWDEEAEIWILHAQYTTVGGLTLVLGNASWPLVGEEDKPPMSSLAPFICADVTNAAATYAIHGNRTHLGGGETANEDGAEELLEKLATTAMTRGLFGGEDYSTAIYPSGDVAALVVATNALALDGDSLIVPAADSPPLAYFGNRLLQGLGEPGPVGPGQVNRRIEETGPLHECNFTRVIIEAGMLVCQPTGGILCHLEIEVPLTLGVPLSTLALRSLPEPDWFLVFFGAVGEDTERALIHGCTTYTFENELGSITCDAGCAGEFVPGRKMALEHTPCYSPGFLPEEAEVEVEEEVEEGVFEPKRIGVSGYLAPPVSLYKGATHLPAGPGHGVDTRLLWQFGQLGGAGEATLKLNGAHKATVDVQLTIIPFYERRQVGLHSGDLLDLSKTGWEEEAITLAAGGSGMAKSLPVVGRAVS